jgi:hypothetical protein
MDLDRVAAKCWVCFASDRELWYWLGRATNRRSRRVSIPILDGQFVAVNAPQLVAEIRARASAEVEQMIAETIVDPPQGLF